MKKQIIFDLETQEKLVLGVSLLNEATKITLGPSGKVVLIDKGMGVTRASCDGYYVAKEVASPDKFVNMGVQLARQGAIKTNDLVGDGTTTTILLTAVLVQEGFKMLSVGHDPILIKRDLDRCLEDIKDQLRKMAYQINHADEIYQVAYISSHGDGLVAEMTKDVMLAIGVDQNINLEINNETHSELHTTLGMNIEQGYLSSYFKRDEFDTEIVLEKPLILFYDRKIETEDDYMKLLELKLNMEAPLVVFAKHFSDKMISRMVELWKDRKLMIMPIPALYSVHRMQGFLQDMAILTDGIYCSQHLGMELKNITIPDLGRAQKVIVDLNYTTIIGGMGKPLEIRKRKEFLEREAEYHKHNHQEYTNRVNRLGKLVGGISCLRVGGYTEMEMNERKLRVEDAVCACRTAMKDGVLPGAGMPLYHISKEYKHHPLLGPALQAPFKQILENSAIDPLEIIQKLTRRRIRKGSWLGYNSRKGKVENFKKTGVFDPLMVTIRALENAISLASMIMMCQVAMVDWDVEYE